MDFAIVKSGSHQYVVEAGQKIICDKIDLEPGSTLNLDCVMGWDESEFTRDVEVKAEIVKSFRGDKIPVFKKKRRHNYRRSKNHRQDFTLVKIIELNKKS
ncbi:50S ribosomal protein L21 [Candidatus Nesciobacter abundans]|uniref:Large ribosomal subunit protein bL21 n=1 Tax=Candidatus Nesciobacter abundans TaxID=2601668 RepID=A0A5C0UHI4_9PROT|nr:50S ribosomal protein L21 [Candidatus Nesciobacter abundans]QEK39187.1 50S ribosomal protein L21 [Candidatus Nesciobacter abundans]